MKFDGNVGDLGSKNESSIIFSISINGKGNEDDFLKYCRNKLIDKKILSDNIKKDPQGNEDLIYTARIKSSNGI